jgi:CubicO group peptidase (beta-lactamase class C family)
MQSRLGQGLLSMPVDPVHGDCDVRFLRVRDAFRELFASGAEIGAGLAVVVDGRLAIDLWGGTVNAAGDPWTPRMLVHTYSVTKAFAAVCLLKLVDRGTVDLDAAVSTYWPEFAARGKSGTTVRHLLSHQAGVVAWSDPQPLEAVLDWDRAVSLCAAEEPEWVPGTACGEHAYFYGHLVGEVVRRVDGRGLGKFLRETISGPLGLDFHVGLSAREQSLCALVVGLDDAWRHGLLMGGNELFRRALSNPPGLLNGDVINGSRWRRAEIPAVNGHGTARSIAGLYGLLLDGRSSNPLLSSEIVTEAVRPQCTGRDRVLDSDVDWGLGFQLSDGTFGMGGLGGATGFADQTRGYGFGFVTRLMADHARADLLEAALNSCL